MITLPLEQRLEILADSCSATTAGGGVEKAGSGAEACEIFTDRRWPVFGWYQTRRAASDGANAGTDAPTGAAGSAGAVCRNAGCIGVDGGIMMTVCRYDGSFEGLLCAVGDSLEMGEAPPEFAGGSRSS